MVSPSFQSFPLSGTKLRNNNMIGYGNICDILCFGSFVIFFNDSGSSLLIVASEDGNQLPPVVSIPSERSRIPARWARS